MLFVTPRPTAAISKKLVELDGLRAQLSQEGRRLVPWIGMLRRVVKAVSIESSTSIEGFRVERADALVIVRGDDRDVDDDNRLAVACYARAWDHARVMAFDPAFHWLDRVILDLHFDVCSFQRDKSPGLWRTDQISVTGNDGRLSYVAPDPDDVPRLMAEVVDWLETGDLDSHVVVRAAMAHLHTVSIHPFRDGNGRISRILQSLVLAREGLVTPEFASIEQYLAEHTPDYYNALRDVQGGSYQPERNASAWVSFCIDAHLAQARQRLEQITQAGARWAFLEVLVEGRGWPDRLVIALEQSLTGGADRTSYAREAGVSAGTATNDFRRLLDAGLVAQQGRTRNIRYHASADLEGLRNSVSYERKKTVERLLTEDDFAIISEESNEAADQGILEFWDN
jgi:Fic family protein